MLRRLVVADLWRVIAVTAILLSIRGVLGCCGVVLCVWCGGCAAVDGNPLLFFLCVASFGSHTPCGALMARLLWPLVFGNGGPTKPFFGGI